MSITEKNGLKINTKLLDFVNNEVIPGTNVKSEEFWISFEKAVHELAPINKKLIQKREDIQKQIDEWHKKIQNPNEKVLLELIGKLNRDSKEKTISVMRRFLNEAQEILHQTPDLGLEKLQEASFAQFFTKNV